MFASEQDRPDVARRRVCWKKYQGRIDPSRLVFIDETWAKTNMTRTRGWHRRGEPTSSSWTILVLIKDARFAPRSERQARGSCSWPYSPDLNPIEQVFAKLKTLLCKAEARTIEAVTSAIGSILGAFTPQECANYVANSGYASI